MSLFSKVTSKNAKAGQWCMADSAGKEECGGLGLDSLIAALDETKVQFAAILVTGVDQQENITSTRPKIVRVNWVGTKVPAMKKMQALKGKETIGRLWNGVVCELDCDRADEISMSEIAGTLLRAGGAHKPTFYDFGDGELKLENVGKKGAGTKKTPGASTSAPAEPAPKAESGGNDLFAELNKGASVTSGLKKIKREDTNKGKKINSVVKAKEKKLATVDLGGTPKIELVGGKTWEIEFQLNNKEIMIEGLTMGQGIRIYKCQGCVIQIKGKCNAIQINNAKDCGIVFENALAACEIANSHKCQVQCIGKVPTMSLDKCTGIKMYISRENLGMEIVSAQCSEVNVLYPGASEEDNMVEIPLAEQFKSTVNDKDELETRPVSH